MVSFILSLPISAVFGTDQSLKGATFLAKLIKQNHHHLPSSLNKNMGYHHDQSSLFISLRYCLVFLCISMMIIQVSQAVNEDRSSSMEDNTEHQFERRSSRKVAQMLQQILQRGEMQVEPYRIHKFLGRLNRRRINDQLKHIGMNNPV